MQIINQVKSYEDACKIKGITPLTVEQFSFLPDEASQKRAFAGHQLDVICEVVREGATFDWSDYSQPKWAPVFDMEVYGDGRPNDGFVLYCVNRWSTSTDVSPRLCLETQEKGKYVATQFLNLFKDLYN